MSKKHKKDKEILFNPDIRKIAKMAKTFMYMGVDNVYKNKVNQLFHWETLENITF